MVKEEENSNKFKKDALIVYFDELNDVKTVYSTYVIKDGMICFQTDHNKITIPLARVIKIKEERE